MSSTSTAPANLMQCWADLRNMIVSFRAQWIGTLTLGVELEVTVGKTVHGVTTFGAEVRELVLYTDTSDG